MIRHYLPFVSALCAIQTFAAEPEVIARAGTVEVTSADIAGLVEHLSDAERQALQYDTETISQLVRSLVAQRLLIKEARDKGWDQRPEVLRQLQRAQEGALAESYLTSLSTPSNDFPSESDIKEFYETNKASFFMPKSYRLAQIYIDTKPDAKAAAAKLAKVKELLEAPKADFGAIAREHSQEPNSAARNGELGWLTDAQIQPDIRSKLPELKLGAVSSAIELNDGWHILKVLDIKEPATLTMDQARANIIQQLRSAKAKAASDAYLGDLLKSNPIAINELAIPKALSGPAK